MGSCKEAHRFGYFQEDGAYRVEGDLWYRRYPR